MVPTCSGVVYYMRKETEMTKAKSGLPAVRVRTRVVDPNVATAYAEWRANGYPRDEEPSFYKEADMLCEVVTWHIEAGSMRVRLLNDDGSPYLYEGTEVVQDMSDRAFRSLTAHLNFV